MHLVHFRHSGGINLLITDRSPDQTDSDEDEHTQAAVNTEIHDTLPNPLSQNRLPLPSLDGQTSGISAGEASVFENPFQKAEEVKHSILEQHVKMTVAVTEEKGSKNKKICWNFRKGKCRYGRKCKYSHDNDIVVKNSDIEGANSEQTGGQNNSNDYGQKAWTIREAPKEVPAQDEEEDTYMSQAKRKKRSGVTDHLVPPKKAMHAYQAQRKQERPWTLP